MGGRPLNYALDAFWTSGEALIVVEAEPDQSTRAREVPALIRESTWNLFFCVGAIQAILLILSLLLSRPTSEHSSGAGWLIWSVAFFATAAPFQGWLVISTLLSGMQPGTSHRAKAIWFALWPTIVPWLVVAGLLMYSFAHPAPLKMTCGGLPC